jgi:thioredoxin reductase (NADPH)
MHLARHARSTTILARSPLERSMSRYLVEQIAAVARIRVLVGVNVTGVLGSASLEAIRVAGQGEEQVLPASALFIFIGAQPHTEWLGEAVELPDQRAQDLRGSDGAPRLCSSFARASSISRTAPSKGEIRRAAS